MMYPSGRAVDAVADSEGSASPSEMSTNVFGSPSFPLIANSLGEAQACPKSFSAQTWIVYVLPLSMSSNRSLSSAVTYSFTSNSSDCLRDRMALLGSSKLAVLTETLYCEIGWSLELSDSHVIRRSCSLLVRLRSMLLGALGIPVNSHCAHI